MPITLPNFLGVAPQREVPDIFNEMLKGYKMSQEPRKMREEAMARQLAIEMAKMQNQYYPKIQDQNLQKGDIDIQTGQLNLQALPQQLKDEALKRALGIQSSQADLGMNPLREQLLNAQIQAQQARAAKSRFESDPVAQMQYLQSVLSSAGANGTNEGLSNLSPLQTAIIKKATGLDLTPKESPEEKRQKDLELFMQKEEVKRKNKEVADLTQPTKATITSNQSVISAANNIIPQIKQLKKMPIPFAKTGALTSPDQYAKYEAQSNAIADGLMAAFGWPKTDQALQMAKQLVKRKALESEASYKQRLDGLIGELEERRASANEILSSSKIKPKQESGAKKGIINGREVTVHPSRESQFIEQGGTFL